ncbi:MAG: DUF1566 domain-containing protein [Campylobacterota bacterium]|nr:DUF1566 domain-containing protein [Campylobacterota bacterium]
MDSDISKNSKVWQDPDTGFIWQVEVYAPKNIEDCFSWEDSFRYAEKLNRENYGGYSDWRVPSIDKLRTVMSENFFKNKKSYTGKTYIKEPLLASMSRRVGVMDD